MESESRDESRDLTHFDRLIRDPQSHHIFFAMRLLEAHFKDAPRFGEARRPVQDKVRFGQEPELAFPRSTIANFERMEESDTWELSNLFFGLFGPNGPLPLHLTEYASNRQRNSGDPTFIAFANMLTHRLTSLLYRAWLQGQPAASFDRGDNSKTERKIAALSGHFGQHLRDRDAMPDLAKRHFAGFLSAGPRHADGLVAMLQAFFSAPVELVQFVGSWLTLERSDCWLLGSSGTLGESTCIGARVWSRTAKFRLKIGPLSLSEYEQFLPGSARIERLRALVGNYLGDQLDWDVNLVLQAEEIPTAQLGGTCRLGQTSWLGVEAHKEDSTALYLDPQFEMPMSEIRPR